MPGFNTNRSGRGGLGQGRGTGICRFNNTGRGRGPDFGLGMGFSRKIDRGNDNAGQTAGLKGTGKIDRSVAADLDRRIDDNENKLKSILEKIDSLLTTQR